MLVRAATAADRPMIWALSTVPNVGATADASAPLDLPPASAAPAQWPDLAGVPGSYTAVGGAFLVVDDGARVVATGGFRPSGDGRAEVLRVRVHPAVRRQGVGSRLMAGLEASARQHGVAELHFDTATNQPEAMAFYDALGYERAGTETQPGWTWTLQYYRRYL